MNQWSFDIIRQSGWDLWTIVCAAAALVLVCYAVFAKLWTSRRGWFALGLIGAGVVGTLLVLFVPALHTPLVGLVWTFVLLSLLSATFYLNLQPQLGTGRMGLLLGMRIVALAMLVPMLFEPVIRYVARPDPERPLLFVVDTSGSMSFPDVQNGPTRVQSIWQTIRPQLTKINEHFVPRFFTFDTDFQKIEKPDDVGTLQADGKATNVVLGIAEALVQSTRPDAAVVLLSDGIDNTAPNVVDAIRAAQRPVHTVLVGSDQTEPATLTNVAVDNVEAAEDFVVNHQSKVKVTVKSTALANRVVDVKMTEIDADGKYIGQTVQEKLVLQPLAEGQTVELPFEPKATGVHRLAVWVDPIPGERSAADNRQEFQGLALDPRVKVLYVEGRARPEYRELNRALSRDQNIEVATLLRIQKDRFAASGTVEGKKLEGLPSSLEEWRKFDVIILGDLDSSFLSKPQQVAIEQVVQEGKGLLMIGGQTSFGPGGYKDSPIEKALPVFVGELNAPQEKTEFVPMLTAEGQTHPAMEGLSEWFIVEGGLAPTTQRQVPPLRGNVVVPRPKSGAQVLLVHKDRPGPDGQPQVILATHRYGEGQSAAFTGDTTYLWYLPLRGMGQDSPYNRFWGQLVRWLAGEDVRNRQKGAGIEGLLNKTVYQLGETVRLRA
ncbi:MAG: glutamine amidotransferase, partial [Tepidisphaeraceae bacterium]